MFWERFSHLCEINNKKPTPVGREIGLSSGILTTWKKEGYCPSGEMLIKVANYFDCSIDYLVGRTDNSKVQISELSNIDSLILENFHSLSSTNQNEVLNYIDYLLFQEEKKRKETLSPSADAEDNARLA